jgi:hypothetical protein
MRIYVIEWMYVTVNVWLSGKKKKKENDKKKKRKRQWRNRREKVTDGHVSHLAPGEPPGTNVPPVGHTPRVLMQGTKKTDSY